MRTMRLKSLAAASERQREEARDRASKDKAWAVALVEEALRDMEDAQAGRLFYEYDYATGEHRLRRRRKPQSKRYRFDERCGAKTRKGTPCRCLPEPGKARCRYHGGRSTGPKTPEGRARIAESNRRRAEARHAVAAAPGQ